MTIHRGGMIPIPEELIFWTADRIAEVLPVLEETRRALWEISTTAQNPKPRGEWPEITTSFGDQPLQFWGDLTPSQREDIVRALELAQREINE